MSKLTVTNRSETDHQKIYKLKQALAEQEDILIKKRLKLLPGVLEDIDDDSKKRSILKPNKDENS